MITNSTFTLAVIAASLVAISLTGCGQTKTSQLRALQDKAESELELILSSEEPSNVRPAPGNQISVLLQNSYGQGLLERLDRRYALFSFSPESDEYVLIWNGPSVFGQVMFTSDLTSSMPSQIHLQSVEIQKDKAVLRFTVSEDNWTKKIGLKPDLDYEVEFNVTNAKDVDFTKIWKNATQQSPSSDGQKAAPEE
jgi:uncharacterized lipoprotein YehR (DUF1307 family)